ncbi:MAG: helix-hairpin-helix domain-containing protein, partial [Eubacteriales bacterium]
FLAELYSKREYIPKEILLAFDFDRSELELTKEYLETLAKRSVEIKIPQKGNHKKLCDMVLRNAQEQAKQYKSRMEHDTKVLSKLSEMLSLDCLPERIEAYDISNIGNEQITAGMIVIENGKFKKSDYRLFKIKEQSGADDYSAMSKAIRRRLSHLSDNTGSYSETPDLILLDGGMTHVGTIKKVLDEMNIKIPVFGMVKDEHHKTRTIVTENDEISIAKEQSVFVFVYKIQEEVHRFTISAMDKSKRKTLKTSSLEKIEGIGEAKAKKLLAHFKTLSSLRSASVEEITAVKGISRSDAEKVFEYLSKK